MKNNFQFANNNSMNKSGSFGGFQRQGQKVLGYSVSNSRPSSSTERNDTENLQFQKVTSNSVNRTVKSLRLHKQETAVLQAKQSLGVANIDSVSSSGSGFLSQTQKVSI